MPFNYTTLLPLISEHPPIHVNMMYIQCCESHEMCRHRKIVREPQGYMGGEGRDIGTGRQGKGKRRDIGTGRERGDWGGGGRRR